MLQKIFDIILRFFGLGHEDPTKLEAQYVELGEIEKIESIREYSQALNGFVRANPEWREDLSTVTFITDHLKEIGRNL